MNISTDYEPEMLLPIVAGLTQKYTSFESTSVTYERAQSLMEAVIYCLEEYRGFCGNAPVDREISLKSQYQAGYELVLRKVNKTITLFNRVSLQLDDFGVKNLRNTIQEGIPAFLKWYDARFCPQNTIITLDYPLLTDLTSLQGVDAIYEYVRLIGTEQKFLHMLDRDYILRVLERYDPDYPDNMENLCDIILPGIIGHLVTRKPFSNAAFQEEEYTRLNEVFGKKTVPETETCIKRLLRSMIEQYYENDPEILAYLSNAVKNTAVRIQSAMRFRHPEMLFLL